MQLRRSWVLSAGSLAAMSIASCGGGGLPPSPVTVGGTVYGLTGTGLELADNASDHLSVQGNGYFTFATSVAPGNPYAVTVLTQPANPSQTCVVAGASGTVGSSGVTVAVTCTTNPTILSLFAGNMGGGGNQNGTGAVASFGFLYSVALDRAGDAYVADDSNGIRKVTAAGVVTTFVDISAFGYNGACDGVGAGPCFIGQIAVDASGNLYVTAPGDDTIRKVTPKGVMSTFAGTSLVTGSADGTRTAAKFNFPQGVAIDAAGNVYVADSGNNAIRKITPAGMVTTLAGGAASGGADGAGPAAQFNDPIGIATDAAGNIYVADAASSTIRRATPAGVVTTLAGKAGIKGTADGVGSAARFYYPWGVAVDVAGNVIVADTGGDSIRKITPAADVTTVAGLGRVPGSVDGTGNAARFAQPTAVALDATGDIYVSETLNTDLRKITASGVVTTLAGSAAVIGQSDGAGAGAQFDVPEGLATDPQGNVYVADNALHTIRKITPDANVTTFAGFPGEAGTQDGTGMAARLTAPSALASDSAGNLYVTQGCCGMREITPAAVVTTMGVASASELTVDNQGNIVIVYADCLIGRFKPGHSLEPLAGNFHNCTFANGPAATATFGYMSGIVTDAEGNIYVSDTSNSVIRKLSPAGLVTTFAGQVGVPGFRDGTGTAAQFVGVGALTIGPTGNLYAVDGTVIRKITPAGVVTTIAGVNGEYAFQPGPLPGLLKGGNGIAMSGSSLYISMAQGVAVIENVP